MAIPHAHPGEVIDLRPLGAALREHETRTLVKTVAMEIIRLVLPKDKKIATHTVPGEITVQCIEGKVAFTALEQTFDMEPSRMLYLTAGQPHSLRAVEDSSLLVTILLPKS